MVFEYLCTGANAASFASLRSESTLQLWFHSKALKGPQVGNQHRLFGSEKYERPTR